MNIDYWKDSLCDILDELDISVTSEQLNTLAISIAGCADCASDMEFDMSGGRTVDHTDYEKLYKQEVAKNQRESIISNSYRNAVANKLHCEPNELSVDDYGLIEYSPRGLV